MLAVIARSEQWDRLPACLFGMTCNPKFCVGRSHQQSQTLRDCFGLCALAMRSVSNVTFFMRNSYDLCFDRNRNQTTLQLRSKRSTTTRKNLTHLED